MKKTESYYPIYLDVRGLKCLVAGGGRVAERKVKGLVSAGADVTVVSPGLTAALSRLLKKGRIRHVRSGYQEKHLRNMRLVIGATGDVGVNERIFQDAEKRGILSNNVDKPKLCRFIVPATLKLGDVSIAICTGGAAPIVSSIIKRDLKAGFLKKYARLATQLKKVRERIKALPIAKKKVFWKKVKSLWANGR